MSLLNRQKIYRQIFRALSDSQNILLVSHINPDGDAIGSLLAFYQILKYLKKDVVMFVDSELPLNFSFLPYFNLIRNRWNPPSLLCKKFDLILVLDCGNFERSGLGSLKMDYQPKIINIDHHHSNDNFGSLNLVDLEASSTCEILYNLFSFFNININNKTALALLTGIVTDTDFFINPNTSWQTLQIASKLLNKGAKLNLIFENIYKRFEVKNLKLWGKALSRLSLDKKSGIATTAIFQDDFDSGIDDKSFNGFSNFLNSLKEAKAVMVLKEESGQFIKGSLRTAHKSLDVSEIAKQYGGGGHKKAAGFLVKGKLVKNKDDRWVIEEV